MAVIIPDIIICNYINSTLNIVRQNWITMKGLNKESSSLLYLIFGGGKIGTYDLYKNAQTIFITQPGDPKHLEAKLSFDHNTTATAPAIVVSLSSENDKNNEISIGEGSREELEDDLAQQYRKVFVRRYATTYSVIVLSENKNEGALIYNLLKLLITASITSLVLEGIENIKIGGQDIRLQTAVVDRLFQRAVTVNFEYEQDVPELVVNNIYRELQLSYQITDQNGITSDPVGPIFISTDESSDSF